MRESSGPELSEGLPGGVREVVERWIASTSRRDAHLVVEEREEDPGDVESRIVRTWMRKCGLSVLVPGVLQGELVTCLVVGPKQRGEMFTEEDFEVLEALSRQSALLLTNQRLYAQVAAQWRRSTTSTTTSRGW